MHTYVYTLIYWKEAYQTAKSQLELQMTIFFLLFFQKLDYVILTVLLYKNIIQENGIANEWCVLSKYVPNKSKIV